MLSVAQGSPIQGDDFPDGVTVKMLIFKLDGIVGLHELLERSFGKQEVAWYLDDDLPIQLLLQNKTV